MKIILDRIDMDEMGLPIATFEVGGGMMTFGSDKMPKGFTDELISNAIVECEIVDGCIVNPVVLYDETKQREEKMRKRLQGLNKRKNG